MKPSNGAMNRARTGNVRARVRAQLRIVCHFSNFAVFGCPAKSGRKHYLIVTKFCALVHTGEVFVQ